ncbi:unnamed protein product [Rangifer tarandus platyrhynchus]|uniref:Uncharacterized protein n=1 Tax=Rangifer tarandus platyrhynchus TaxID=3082113 RepID=A0AC59ZQK6_RANTA
MGFSRQEYWSGLPCPLPGDLPAPGIEPTFPAAPELQVASLSLSHRGSPLPTTNKYILMKVSPESVYAINISITSKNFLLPSLYSFFIMIGTFNIRSTLLANFKCTIQCC